MAIQDSERAGFRTSTDDGRQVVVIDSGISYAWSGTPPLEVDEEILVPGNNWVAEMRYGSGPYPAIVRALGSSYPNELVDVISRTGRRVRAE